MIISLSGTPKIKVQEFHCHLTIHCIRTHLFTRYVSENSAKWNVHMNPLFTLYYFINNKLHLNKSKKLSLKSFNLNILNT